ncbi:hypothetical protein G6F65_022347 [Rhizopus arrhizus]|nr:hypothetical protein G6F65_022347 [Rhizopus arrhizus]
MKGVASWNSAFQPANSGRKLNGNASCRLHVRIAQLGVRRVRKGGIQLPPVLVHALAHGALERGVRPTADAGVVIGRDIGGVDRAEGRIQRQSARIGFAARRGVAGDAIARGRHQAPAFDGAH